MNKAIEFPAIDISITSWQGEIINEVVLFDEYFYNRSDEIFKELCLNHKIADSKGNIYVIIDVEDLKGLRKWLRFFPKRRIMFKRSNETITLDELRDFILKKVEALDDNDYKKEWIQSIKKATTFKELITGGE